MFPEILVGVLRARSMTNRRPEEGRDRDDWIGVSRMKDLRKVGASGSL